MKNISITSRVKNGFYVSVAITLLGYFFSFGFAMFIGLGCLFFVLIDFLADNTTLKFK